MERPQNSRPRILVYNSMSVWDKVQARVSSAFECLESGSFPLSRVLVYNGLEFRVQSLGLGLGFGTSFESHTCDLRPTHSSAHTCLGYPIANACYVVGSRDSRAAGMLEKSRLHTIWNVHIGAPRYPCAFLRCRMCLGLRGWIATVCCALARFPRGGRPISHAPPMCMLLDLGSLR